MWNLNAVKRFRELAPRLIEGCFFLGGAVHIILMFNNSDSNVSFKHSTVCVRGKGLIAGQCVHLKSEKCAGED